MRIRLKSSYAAALGVVVVLGLWMASGLLSNEPEESASSAGNGVEVVAPMKVAARRIELEPIMREIVLQGQLEPVREVDLRAETSGRVAALPTPKGARVEAGTALVQLDSGTLEVELEEAQAMVKSARGETRAAKELQQRGLQAQVQLEQLEAALAAARAAEARIRHQLNNTVIAAPFDGVLAELPVAEGDWAQTGDVVASLVDDSELLAVARAAQQNVVELEESMPLDVELLTGERLAGEIRFIAPVADPESRSFRVEAVVDNPERTFAAGTSATLKIPVEEVQAVFITPSVLVLDDAGRLGVKVIDDEDRVAFQTVELVSSTPQGAWVSGIANNRRLITLGQGFVTDGERVTVQGGEQADGVAASVSPAAPVEP